MVMAALVAAAAIGTIAYFSLGSNGSPVSFIRRQYASLIPAPGESSTFSTFVATKSRDQLTLLSMKLLPLKGYPTPVLRHVMLLRIASHDPTDFLANYGWPISEPNGYPYQLSGFRGSTVETGRPSRGGGYPEIVYNIAGGPNATIVADAGVSVTYQVNGSTETSDIDDGAVACFQNRVHGKPKLTYCTTARMRTVENAILKND